MTSHTTTGTTTSADGAVLPVNDLPGKTVWTDSGKRLGVLKDVVTDAEGRIVSLDVQRRWILGPHHTVSASGMRFDGDDLVVPAAADPDPERTDLRRRSSAVPERSSVGAAPVLLAGRSDVRRRFGGGDLLASLGGALASFALVLILGTVLGAAFDSSRTTFDTSVNNWSDVTSTPWIVGAVALAVACLVGGWVAGRAARYDGAANGVLSVVLLLVLGAASIGAGAWAADSYDVANVSKMPAFSSSDFQVEGVVGCLVVLALMLLAGAFGGSIGSLWHRRADRAMLRVVEVGDGDALVEDRGVVDDRAAGRDRFARERMETDDTFSDSARPAAATGVRGDVDRGRVTEPADVDDVSPTSVRDDALTRGSAGAPVMRDPLPPEDRTY